MTGLAIGVRRYRLRLRHPFVTAAAIHTVREGYLVRLQAADGTWGVGDAAPLLGHGGELLADVVPALRRLADALPDVLRGDAPDHPDAWRRVMRRLRGVAPDALAACAGLDLALADFAARRAGIPLARWLNPAARDAVSVNAAIGVGSLGEVTDQAVAAVADGYRTLKLKVGLGDAGDVTRVAVVRAAVGDAIALRLDANGAWDEPQAIAMLETLAPYVIEYVEQPLPARDVAALARVRAASPVPVAADEALLLPGGFEAVLGANAADVLIVKPMLVGGLAAAWDLITEIEPWPRPPDVVITTALDGAVGRLGALHLAAALPGVTRACGLATGDMLAEDVAPGPTVVAGSMVVPATTGLGVDVAGDWRPIARWQA